MYDLAGGQAGQDELAPLLGVALVGVDLEAFDGGVEAGHVVQEVGEDVGVGVPGAQDGVVVLAELADVQEGVVAPAPGPPFDACGHSSLSFSGFPPSRE